MLHAIYSAHRPSEIKQKKPFGVPDYKALMLATILEETLMELYCLDNLNTHLRIKNLMIDINYLKAKRFNLTRPLEEDLLKRIDPTKLDCPEYKRNKLVDDRKLIIKVVQDSYLSLKCHRTYAALGHYVLSNIEHTKYCKELEEEENSNAKLKHDVHKRLRLRRRYIRTEQLATETLIYKLTVEIEDQGITEALRRRYVEGWERARSSQQALTIAGVEEAPAGLVRRYKGRVDDEQIVHSNIEYHLTIAIEETLNQIEEWMDKFDQDMENIDLKIQIKKHEFHEVKGKRKALDERFTLHEKEMTDWKTFKTERENARLYRERMTNAAVTVQAWWRGLLVRKQLGPHRVRKPRKHK